MSLIVYLNAPGKVPGLGHEFGLPVANGIARYDNRYGSTRYVYYVDGKAVSVLQVVTYAPFQGQTQVAIANVYTRIKFRRKGYARKLLIKARENHGVIVHSRHLTKQGKKWADVVKENPIEHPWWWAAGAAGAMFFGLFVFNRWSQSLITSKIAAALPPGVTLQTPTAADTYIVPKSRESVNLSLAQMPTFNLHFVSNGNLTFTPSSGVIDVVLTDFGATVTAVAQGSAEITITYAPDTTGSQDAIIGVGVFA
jgi:hypothetical protein